MDGLSGIGIYLIQFRAFLSGLDPETIEDPPGLDIDDDGACGAWLLSEFEEWQNRVRAENGSPKPWSRPSQRRGFDGKT